MREVWYVFDKTGFSAGAVEFELMTGRRFVTLGAGGGLPPGRGVGAQQRDRDLARVRLEPLAGLAARLERIGPIRLRPQVTRPLDGLPPAA